jgi:hypothetical protein
VGRVEAHAAPRAIQYPGTGGCHGNFDTIDAPGERLHAHRGERQRPGGASAHRRVQRRERAGASAAAWALDSP